MSFLQRFSADANNACDDLYSSWVLGDDAGKSAKFTLVLRPKSLPIRQKGPVRIDLGMTFLEINNRAYVKSVAPGSVAAQAGVLPQDAVQYATLLKSEWLTTSKDGNGDNTNNNNNDNDNINRTTIHPDDDEETENQIASQRVLEMESKGMRITYDELRQLLAEAMDPTQSAFLSPPTPAWTKAKHAANANANASKIKQHQVNNTSNANRDRMDIPVTVNICVPVHAKGDNSSSSQLLKNKAIDSSAGAAGGTEDNAANAVMPAVVGNNAPYSGDMPRPVVFCFRRTRQRRSSLHHRSILGMPSFRLDDECDFASSLVRRLAPTADMETPPPDTWEELVHDGTDWLLGRGSMLPPKRTIAAISGTGAGDGGGGTTTTEDNYNDNEDDPSQIPLDAFEKTRSQKLAALRSRMAAEAHMQIDRSDDVEAVTIRGMIQKAVGLAFVRASKVVLGLSFHAGSGIVLARLSDGTWSAPSAIGTWGLGLGIQFGLEVAEYIFILQTTEALEHFKRGGSFTVGGNMGLAVAGVGREAYGAASVGGNACGSISQVKDDEYNDNDSREMADGNPTSSVGIAPVVAYAKSQGLYVGVSLEGSRIYARDDLNRRTYKFACGRDVTANDILSGKIPTPHEAEEVYASLHSVEFAHEMSCLPRPPELLRRDSANAWYYDKSTLAASRAAEGSSSYNNNNGNEPFKFLSLLTPKEKEELEDFETQFKKLMYGGVSVQRLLVPDSESRSGRTGKERRTLWLMLPEAGSLRLGFVSKLSDGDAGNSSGNGGGNGTGNKGTSNNKSSSHRGRKDDPNRMYDGDVGTVGSEEVTLDSALNTKDGSTIAGAHIRTGNVQLSNRHSVALTDISVVSQEPPSSPPIRLKGGDDKMEHLRIISIQDVAGASLLFLANNFREAELLVCGLKLLLERETLRLGVRGGLPLTAFGYSARNSNLEGITSAQTHMSPSAARGFRDMPQSSSKAAEANKPGGRNHKDSTGYLSSSDGTAGEESVNGDNVQLPDSRRAWGNVPGRNYMRGQAAVTVMLSEAPSKSSTASGDDGGGGRNGSHNNQHAAEQGVPHYMHGQQVIRDVARNVRLPLPFPLCRVLLLDSTSPVIRKWENDRGDTNFDKSRWAFLMSSPGNSAHHPPRHLERHSSEHQLIASGSMCGAYRSVSFDRPRYGSIVRLTETHAVDADDSKKLLLTIEEMNPRRGFSICIRMLLRPHGKSEDAGSCDASIIAEIQPVGKDMSNQAAVHKAFLLVLDEVKLRYGTEGYGLLAGFRQVVDNMASTGNSNKSISNNNSSSAPAASFGDQLVPRIFHRTGPAATELEEKKIDHPTSSITVPSSSSYSRDNGKKKGSTPSSAFSTSTKTTAKVNNSNNKNNDIANSGLVSFEDMLKTGRQSPELDEERPTKAAKNNTEASAAAAAASQVSWGRPSTPSLLGRNFPEPDPAKRIIAAQQKNGEVINSNGVITTSTNEDDDEDETPKETRLIEVKPLPKIRLSLMPSPREEDEEAETDSLADSAAKNKNKKGGSKYNKKGTISSSNDNKDIIKNKKRNKRRSFHQRVSSNKSNAITATIKKFSR